MRFFMTWKVALLIAMAWPPGFWGQAAAAPASAPKSPSDQACPPASTPRTFGLKDSGDVVTGPVCVTVRFNGLRYSSELGRLITFTAGPNLATTIATAPIAGGAAPAGSAAIPDIVDQLTTQSNLWISFAARNEQMTATVTAAVNALQSLVNQSDDLFRSNGADGVLKAANDARLAAAIDNASKASWAASDNIQASLKALQAAVSKLLLSNPTDADKTKLAAIQTAITSVLNDLAPSMVNGDKTAAFNKQKAVVDYWHRIIDGLALASFEKSTYIPCGITVNQNKQIAVRLYTADRLPSFASQPVTLSDAKDPFVTVNCPSPFVISAGVELRFLKTSTFGLVPSGTSGTNHFGVTDNQDIIPLPAALAHVRLLEDASNRCGLFGSVGVAAHSQGSGTAGSAAEYLAGLSLGLFRTMFITAGVHFGKVSALSGGYNVGDPVPTGVTTAPVTGSYKAGFGLAFTFSKP
jgi:ElaB/YqjD/DUF883 family membrane-anchored ribosome-binding protein